MCHESRTWDLRESAQKGCTCRAYGERGILEGVKLGGVEVSDSAAAQLACLLHENGEEALAYYLGYAIDHLHDHFALTARDREAVRHVLMDCPAGLADLRAVLLADEIGRVNSA